MDKTLALILAGGKGTRMGALCRNRPKPMLPVTGGCRVIDFTLSNCVRSGLNKITLLLDYQSEKIEEYVRKWQMKNSLYIEIDYIVPSSDSYTGTANAVYQNIDYLNNSETEQVLILAADHIYHMDYREMLYFHRKSSADVTVSVASVPFDQVHKFGTVLVQDDVRIVDFIEKSENSNSNLASMGIYIFDKRLLVKRLIEDAVNPRSRHDFGYSIMPDSVGRDKVFAYPFTEYWQDIGTPEAYYWSNMDILTSDIHDSFKSRVLTGESEGQFFNDSDQENIRNCFVGPGCTIEGSVENSILTSGVRIAKDAVVLDSILMDSVRIGRGSYVSRCILEQGSVVGRNCIIYESAGIRVISDFVTRDLIGSDRKFLISNLNKLR